MNITCPKCDTSYNMAGKMTHDVHATIVCSTCTAIIDSSPRGFLYGYTPKLTIRKEKTDG